MKVENPFVKSPIQRARDRVGAPAEVLARHGIPVRNGVIARCPFPDHADSTPSFSLYTGRDGKARWFCFGCDVGGDALDLEARLSGRSIKELVK